VVQNQTLFIKGVTVWIFYEKNTIRLINNRIHGQKVYVNFFIQNFQDMTCSLSHLQSATMALFTVILWYT